MRRGERHPNGDFSRGVRADSLNRAGLSYASDSLLQVKRRGIRQAGAVQGISPKAHERSPPFG